MYNFSDEAVCDRWSENPYFQYFTGEEFFQHTFPHERSSISHCRKRLGDQLDILLQESLNVAHKTGALKPSDLSHITVDTTVQPKNITFPTDAKLMYTAIIKLGQMAKEQGVVLRQSYVRVAKMALVMAGCFKVRYRLRYLSAGEVECIAKGKPHKPYEYGVKVSITTTNKQCTQVGASR